MLDDVFSGTGSEWVKMPYGQAGGKDCLIYVLESDIQEFHTSASVNDSKENNSQTSERVQEWDFPTGNCLSCYELNISFVRSCHKLIVKGRVFAYLLDSDDWILFIHAHLIIH